MASSSPGGASTDARRNGTFPKSRRLEASGAAWNCGPSDFPAIPQETTENSVDLAHLQYVHGYDDVKAAGSTTADGALLVSRFDFRSRRRIAGFTDIIYDFSVTAYVHGLGYSFVDIHERTIGIDSRMWILATPVDGTFIDLVLAGQVREIRKPKRPIAGLAFLPVKLRTSFMNKIWIFMQKRDVIQDVEIWGRKSTGLIRVCAAPTVPSADIGAIANSSIRMATIVAIVGSTDDPTTSINPGYSRRAPPSSIRTSAIFARTQLRFVLLR